MKLLFLLFIFALSQFDYVLAAERHLLVMGGGGEPEAAKGTIFDNELRLIADFPTINSWKYDVSFNGGHEQTEEILNEKFPKAQSKGPFTKERFNELLEQYAKKISTGEIKSGDQLMILIDSHGLPASSYEQTHMISVGNRGKRSQPEMTPLSDAASLDALSTITKLASAKGIKLAIVDLSCYSGNSQRLANANTCVVSASSEDLPSYPDFGRSFAENLKSGRSLEEVFLAARRTAKSLAYPMISSEIGKGISLELQKKLWPYFASGYLSKSDFEKITEGAPGSYVELYGLNNEDVCLRNDAYLELRKQFAILKQTAAFVGNTSSIKTLDRLDSKIKEYRERQDLILNDLKNAGMPLLSTKETFSCATSSRSKTTGTLELTYTWAEILRLDIDAIIYASKENGTSPCWEQIKRKKKEILEKNSKLELFAGKSEILLEKMNSTYDLVREIATEEKALYQQMYEFEAKKNARKSICSEFIL